MFLFTDKEYLINKNHLNFFSQNKIKNRKMYGILIFVQFNFLVLTSAFNCELPNGCQINDVHLQINYYAHEKTSIEVPGILCDIRDEKFQFSFPMPSPLLESELFNYCQINEIYKDAIEFRFHSNFILSKQFSLTNLFLYSDYFNKLIAVNFVNLKGFEIDIKHDLDQNVRFIAQNNIDLFQCTKCNMEFYSNGRQVKTCQDIIDTNNDLVRSWFHIRRYTKEWLEYSEFVLFDSQFKTTLCPLVFMNSNISSLEIIGLADTFYKRNILAFENRTFHNLNSTIKQLYLIRIENINIDSNLLNPSVFQNLETISFIGSVNKIDGNSFNGLKLLYLIEFDKIYYRDMIHKNGIKWIHDLNHDLDVNLSNFNEIENKFLRTKSIQISSNKKIFIEKRMSKVFPDKDFCLYKDFPFNQLVFLMEYEYEEALTNLSSYYTCTYLWLVQYFYIFIIINNKR